jgi:dynein heavy chain 2
LEEIKAKYYRELKKFMHIPLNFKGANEILPENNIFSVMIDQNTNRFQSVYAKADNLFLKLTALQDQFKVSSISVVSNVALSGLWPVTFVLYVAWA